MCPTYHVWPQSSTHSLPVWNISLTRYAIDAMHETLLLAALGAPVLGTRGRRALAAAARALLLPREQQNAAGAAPSAEAALRVVRGAAAAEH